MRVLSLLLLGVIGALGVLRGIEVLLVSHEFSRAMLPLAMGFLGVALFLQQWKLKKAEGPKPAKDTRES